MDCEWPSLYCPNWRHPSKNFPFWVGKLSILFLLEEYARSYNLREIKTSQRTLKNTAPGGHIRQLEYLTMGGARSHDIEDGILNPKAPDYEEQYWALRRMGARFRVNHHSWWKQELPDKSEYEEARHSLESIHYEMDYVITHCAPNSIVDILGNGGYVHDHLTGFLEEVKERAKFHYWLFGHYHDNKIIDDRFVLLWEQMVQVV